MSIFLRKIDSTVAAPVYTFSENAAAQIHVATRQQSTMLAMSLILASAGENMLRLSMARLSQLCLVIAAAVAFVANPALAAPKSIYDFTLKSIDGQPTPLSEYHGKVVLLVNVASRCGFTPQYTALESVYEKYKSRGLVIVGIPANNFGGQEPGSNEEIKTFCTKKYNVSFPMMSKVSVKGEDMTPLYKFLTTKDTDPKFSGEIGWNFTKFLFDRHGEPVARFDSAITPDSAEVTAAIESALGH